MSKRALLFVVGLLIIAATAGCFDLFAVPGVAVSPDGSQVYFLSGGGLTSDTGGVTSLSSVSIDGGDPTSITTADKENLTTAFAVNPTNGDVAYVQTGKASGGTQVMIYSGGSSHELVGTSAFSSIGVGTMMRYSPDGSKIAVAMTMFPASVTLDMLGSENSSSFDPTQLAGTQFVVYLINPADGSMTAISDPVKEAANTVAWSPDSKLLAYNAWIDGNGDGKIATMPDFASLAAGGGAAAGPGDTSQIRIYDTSSGSTTPINSQSIDYAEAFISNTEVAYVSLDFTSLMAGGAGGGASGPSVMAYDVASGSSRVAYTGQGSTLVIGMELSPDGSQIAWVELPDSQSSVMGGGGGSGSSPSHLYVGANFDASAGPLAEIPGDTGFPDAPVWTPDGKSILISSTNIFASLIGQFSAGFGGAAGGDATPTEAIPTQKLLKVDVASKAVTTVYEGPMSNSSFFASIFGLANSGAMDQLGQLGGSSGG
jgi:Tol biopolymer transport system component